ncbi:unnamed protein product [Triticum turgidum subsp. durum]|uniref:Uncharacterized protein n=1 Tax=Triticum turgidum subsp. durum TaxID=4567 RepID=A0A9R0TPY3_TRITD|nr:unnamed protein product [Triticum turgidum subsp. durum]
MDKSAGVFQSDFHDCKLSFLQLICDHDLFVEMTGMYPAVNSWTTNLGNYKYSGLPNYFNRPAILFRDFGPPPQRDATSLEQRVRRGGEELVIYMTTSMLSEPPSN